MKNKTTKTKTSPAIVGPLWHLRLYILGHTPNSTAALSNLKSICADRLHGCKLEVIDLLKQPHLARHDQIIAIPTLVRRLPMPMMHMIGDLSNPERVLVGLGLSEAVR